MLFCRHVVAAMCFSITAMVGAAVAGLGYNSTLDLMVLKADINPESNDYCGDSTFEDHTSEASPLAADCLRIAHNIRNGGSWTLYGNKQRRIAQYGTCAFGAEDDSIHMNVLLFTYISVGNQDVIDAIESSVNKFQRPDGKVGAAGVMICGIKDTEVYAVRWGIYHS
jgi:hypothetical protein